MKIIARDYGVTPGNTDVKALEKLLEKLKDTNGEKELIFESGDYVIDASLLESRLLYITNTVGDREFSRDETPHKNRAMLYLSGVKDLKIDGYGARFVADGKCTNAAFEECENVEMRNVAFSAISPDMHEIRVIQKSKHYVDYETDGQTRLLSENGRLYFVGKDYKVKVNHKAKTSYHIGLVKASSPEKIERVRHPLADALKIKQLEKNRFRAYYLGTAKFTVGNAYYIYDVRRQYAGIFLNKCKSITLCGVSQKFNYSLALVAQDCDTLSFDGLDFSPEKDENIKMASAADFIQICMCRGKISVKNSFFCGAGDDCLNAHGIHFKISERLKDEITVRFMHPQTHGFDPLRVGDEIAFISSNDLLEYGRAKILESSLLNEYEIRLKLSPCEIPPKADVIEDVSACPELFFEGNTVSRIITRGILYTSRGKCEIKNNRFTSCTMSGVLLSDDAKSWYESGMCRDVLIEGNAFDYCGETPILIKPENRIYSGAVHKNITIKNNAFKKYDKYCISAKATDNITISGNVFSNGKAFTQRDCKNIITDDSE